MPHVTPRPEYPRPRLVRNHWLNLNGEWEFDYDTHRVGLTNRYFEGKRFHHKIVVPFAYQWEMSGHGERSVEEVVWYARDFDVPESWIKLDCDIVLHFGAVDYRCTVWVNGHEVGHNEGGHVPFSFDIGPYVTSGTNRIYVRVEDPQDPYLPRGKQAVNAVSRGCDYFCTTGIWQTVWLEPVPCMRIEDVIVVSELEEYLFDVRVMLHAPASDFVVRAVVRDGETVVAESEARAKNGMGRLRIPIPDARRWSPEDPHLYDIELTLLQDGQPLDRIQTYAGMRTIETSQGQVVLNGQPIFLRMVLDQGYWPESGMTAPSDEALRADVEWAKRFGFNGARKHQKAEDPRWLYWCDRLGLLVWAEMPNARAWSPYAEERMTVEWERAVRRDMSHPCVIAWVPVNESWGVPALEKDHPGQYAFVERLVALTRRLDGTRPVIDNDGWEHTDVSDIFAIHDYTATGDEIRARYRATREGGPMITQGWGTHPKSYFARGARYRGQPVVLSEIGGFLSIPTDLPPEKRDALYTIYGSAASSEDLMRKIEDILRAIAEQPFVVGFCYTQLTDIEQEANGLLTYDRRPKIDPSCLAVLHEELFGPQA